MVKRITYLSKHQALTNEEFREYWATTHAAIARDLPGVLSYRQNRIVHIGDAKKGEPYPFDGIVELWFEDQQSAAAGFGSEVADRLIADEPHFLEGLVGSEVVSGSPTPDWSTKVWLLARWEPEAEESDRLSCSKKLLDEIEAIFPGVGVVLNVLREDAPRLERVALHVDPFPPQLAVVLQVLDSQCALTMVSRLEDLLETYLFCLCRVQILVADELRII